MTTHTRIHFDDGRGVTIWIAWDDEGRYEVAKTEMEALQRLSDEGLDWRSISLAFFGVGTLNLSQEDMIRIEKIVVKERG